MRKTFAIVFASALLLSGHAFAQSVGFVFPVECRLGQTCHIQNYVDSDPAQGRAKDYRGGSLTYDKHTGVDIRLPSLAAKDAGVAVLAAAEGTVLRARDGVPDISVKAPGRAAEIEGQDCGNALVVRHAGGLETYYCHLAKGSLRVKPGDPVRAGQAIARVGLSGMTEYPHLHFTVRRNGQVVDPFASGERLWLNPPAYVERVVLNAGFRPGPPSMEDVEAGRDPSLSADQPALVAYARGIGLRTGDEQELILRAPDGTVLASNRLAPLRADRAQHMLFVGKRKPPNGWPKGAYVGQYRIWNAGKVVLERSFRTSF